MVKIQTGGFCLQLPGLVETPHPLYGCSRVFLAFGWCSFRGTLPCAGGIVVGFPFNSILIYSKNITVLAGHYAKWSKELAWLLLLNNLFGFCHSS